MDTKGAKEKKRISMGRLLFQIESGGYCQLKLSNMIVDVYGFVDVDGGVPALLVDHEHELVSLKRRAYAQKT